MFHEEKTFGLEWNEKEDSKFSIQTSNRKWWFEAINKCQAKMWIEHIIVRIIFYCSRH